MNSARLKYAVLLIATIALGLASRRWAHALPAFVGSYVGDALWATAAYWTISLIIPHANRTRRGVIAFTIAVAVEVSQLFHPAWLEAIRRRRIGGWILGFGFLWSDLVCYAIGVVLAIAVDKLIFPQGSAG